MQCLTKKYFVLFLYLFIKKLVSKTTTKNSGYWLILHNFYLFCYFILIAVRNKIIINN